MNATEQFIYLCACAATGKAAKLDNADFDQLWQMAQGHNLTALTARALSTTKAFHSAPAEERNRWSNTLNSSIKKTMLFDAERKTLLSYFEKNGIWYLPLKGAVINGLYPSYGTREFADNDILIDPNRMADAKEFLLKRGYSFRTDEFAADEYSKAPFFNIEIHRTLVEQTTTLEQFYEYYKDVKSRLIKEKGTACGYRFTDEDFYIYFIFHAFKHYDGRGTGFRTVADEYVVLHSDYFQFDFKVIEDELRKLGLLAFERQLRHLADTLFGQPEKTEENISRLSQEDSDMLFFMLSCGTFGNLENLFAKEFASEKKGNPSKSKYYLKRIFPPISTYKYSNPFVYKHKAVYPFFLAYRLATKPIQHRKYIKKELNAIKKIKK